MMSFGGNPVVQAAFGLLGVTAVTITRRTNTTGADYTDTTIYSGNGNLQEGGGSTYFNPGGAVEVADAVLSISASDPDALPAVKVGDVVTRTSDAKTFSVASVALRPLLPHLELSLKRGGLPMRQGGGRA